MNTLQKAMEAIKENKNERIHYFTESFGIADFEENCFQSREEILEAEREFFGECFESVF